MTVEVQGLDELMKKLDTVAKLEGAKRGIKAAALFIKGKVAEYPPASSANAAGGYPKRWYQRGAGPRYARRDGSVGGRNTSETLGRKWTIKMQSGGLGAIVGNNVSYGPYVQDEQRQARFHKRRGWKTTKRIIDHHSKQVVEMVAKEIDRDLEKA